MAVLFQTFSNGCHLNFPNKPVILNFPYKFKYLYSEINTIRGILLGQNLNLYAVGITENIYLMHTHVLLQG